MATNPSQLYIQLMGAPEVQSRVGSTRELLNVHMTFPHNWWWYNIGDLHANVDYIKAELKWYLNGDKSDLTILQHASIWNNCVDEAGEIQSNYGFYFHEQAGEIISELHRDPSSRRAVLYIGNSSQLYNMAPDVPCTNNIQFIIRQDLLHAIVTMRSQDAVYGLRNDIAAFQLFKLFMANSVGYPPGFLHINVGSFHVYSRHYKKLHENMYSAPEWFGHNNLKEFQQWID